MARLLVNPTSTVAARGGIDYWLTGIAVRSLSKPRPQEIPPALFTEDARRLVEDANIDVVIECIGGTGVAAELVEEALRRGKHVVTANKDLLATRGPELRALAAKHGVTIAYEAAVGGAIPIVRTIRESLAGEEILEVGGVLNGTTNFILSQMSAGATYRAALAQAQRLGFAEADPASDVEGIDAAHKLAILAQLAFRRALVTHQIPRAGITQLTPDDLSLAKRLGYTLKLVACARADASIVTPAYVRSEHPFAQPVGPQNCIRVTGRASGSLTFAGTGAGSAPTASAVIGDVVAVLRTIEVRRIVGARPDVALKPEAAGAERPIPLHLVVRLVSFRDARPAREELNRAGVETRLLDGVPALVTAQRLDGSSAIAEMLRVLSVAGIAPESIIPLWEDLPHDSDLTRSSPASRDDTLAATLPR